MTFTNEQIPMDVLPSIEDVTYEKLDAKYQRISLVQASILSIILVIAYGIAAVFEPALLSVLYLVLFLTSWLLFSVFYLAAAYFAYEKAGVALRERDILYKSGIFFHDVEAVPFNRIQHCELSQGPLERYFGLSSVSVFTAGGSSSDVVIEGLSREKAIRLKNYILRNAAIDEEE
jgi:membrane protein YdbS with pleckstrin-like domain